MVNETIVNPILFFTHLFLILWKIRICSINMYMTMNMKKQAKMFGWLLPLVLSVLASCSDPSDVKDVEELKQKGENLFKVGSVSTPVDECLDSYTESDGGVTHMLHFFTTGYYQMNGDGTCSENKLFKGKGAYVEIPAFDKGQSELLRLMTGTYINKASNTDSWSGDYIVTKTGASTTRALSYDKMTDLNTSAVQVKKKGNIYEITWEGTDEKNNPRSLYYYGMVRSEKMLE